MECPGISTLVTEGDTLAVDFRSGEVINRRTGQTRKAQVLPEMLREILEAGGVLQILAREGFIDLPGKTIPVTPA
jgi:3-isopropylmalate/(R)-2-methylmalate dehydratase small subunit